MYDFKTVEEIAAKWSVSTRYVQSLCRQGRIEGAVKRAGVWFIPATVITPSKNIKSNGRYLRFCGTKKKIFEKAVELFSENSYDVITIKDITDAIGIRQSSMYNHFKSKQEMLDIIYDFYCYYHTVDRPQLEDLEPVLKNGSLMDIMNCVLRSFKEEHRDLMINISKIMLSRLSIDNRAKEIAKLYTVKAEIEFVEAVFNRAVVIGRLAPLDTHAMAVFLCSVRTFMFQNWIINSSPELHRKWTQDEQLLLKYATKLITDLKPPTTG